ncbi:MAG: hypothetical protein RLZZ398_726 [Verrucomicrobiota bacterium]
MAGGNDEVSVAGIKIEVFQALESREGIWLDPAHVGLDLGENFTQQRKPSLTLEALEEGAPEEISVLWRSARS